MTDTTSIAKALNILVVEDTPAEQGKARRAVEASGHSAIVTSSMEEALVALRTGTVDGVMTDLMFTPDRGGESQLAHYRSHQPAMGLLVVIAAMASGKQVVVCTDSDHHGLDASWIYDGFIAHLTAMLYKADPAGHRDGRNEAKLPFGWIDGKDWEYALETLVRRIEASQ